MESPYLQPPSRRMAGSLYSKYVIIAWVYKCEGFTGLPLIKMTNLLFCCTGCKQPLLILAFFVPFNTKGSKLFSRFILRKGCKTI